MACAHAQYRDDLLARTVASLEQAFSGTRRRHTLADVRVMVPNTPPLPASDGVTESSPNSTTPTPPRSPAVDLTEASSAAMASNRHMRLSVLQHGAERERANQIVIATSTKKSQRQWWFAFAALGLGGAYGFWCCVVQGVEFEYIDQRVEKSCG